MTDWLSDEFELVEISDASGRKVEMCYLATVEYSGKLYHILGTVHEDEADEQMENDRLLLVRQDCTPDGAQEYVVTEDENEIEQVFGQYVMETLALRRKPPGRRIMFLRPECVSAIIFSCQLTKNHV